MRRADDSKRSTPCNQMVWWVRCLFTNHSPWWLNSWNTKIKQNPRKDKTKYTCHLPRMHPPTHPHTHTDRYTFMKHWSGGRYCFSNSSVLHLWMLTFCTKRVYRNLDSVSSWVKWQKGLLLKQGQNWQNYHRKVLWAELWTEINLPTGFLQQAQNKKENACTYVKSEWTEGNATQTSHLEVHHNLLLKVRSRALCRGLFWDLSY